MAYCEHPDHLSADRARLLAHPCGEIAREREAYRKWHACSRDDDPTEHDGPRSPWVARALAGTLPAKVLA